MKKIIATLAVAGLAAGLGAGFASADEIPVDGVGTVHYGQDNGGYVVAEGNGDSTPDGYVGVEGNDGVVLSCNDDDGEPGTADDSYSGGNGDAADPVALANGEGDTSCVG